MYQYFIKQTKKIFIWDTMDILRWFFLFAAKDLTKKIAKFVWTMNLLLI